MSVRSRLRRIPLLVRIVAPVAAAALVAWPLGGWDTVTLVSRTLPEYASNQVFQTHRFDIRVDDAWVTSDDHPAGYAAPTSLDPDAPAETYLVVRVEMVNTTTDTATSAEIGGYLIPLIDGVDMDRYVSTDYVLVSDRTTLPELNPGVLTDMYVVWTIPKGAVEPGDDLRIDLYDGVPHKSTLFYGLRWDFEKAGYALRNVSER